MTQLTLPTAYTFDDSKNKFFFIGMERQTRYVINMKYVGMYLFVKGLKATLIGNGLSHGVIWCKFQLPFNTI